MIILKIIGGILLGILLILLFVSLFSIKVMVSYKYGRLEVFCKYMFVEYTAYPEPEDGQRLNIGIFQRFIKKKPPETEKEEPAVPEKEQEKPIDEVITEKIEDTVDKKTDEFVKKKKTAREPYKEEEKEPSKKEKPKKSKTEPEKKTEDKEEDKIQQIKSLLNSSKKALKTLKNHFIIDKIETYISVGGEDAHKTAVNFGRLNIAVINLLAVLGEIFTIKVKKVHIVPNFLEEENDYHMYVRFRIRIIWILLAVIQFGIAFIKLTYKNTEKGGKQHEQQPKTAAS